MVHLVYTISPVPSVPPALFMEVDFLVSVIYFYHFSFYLIFFNRNGGIHPRITKQFRPELAQKVTDLTCARPRFFPHSIFGYAESEPPRPQSSDPTSKFGKTPSPRPSLHIGGARPRPEYCTAVAT